MFEESGLGVNKDRQPNPLEADGTDGFIGM